MNTNYMINCPLCRRYGGDRHYARVYRETYLDMEGFVHYDICPYCGLVFQWMPLDVDSMSEFYDGLYRENKTPEMKLLDTENVRAYCINAYVKSIRPSYDKVLDIGSSTGALLHILKSNGVNEGWGVEPNTVFRGGSQLLTDGVVPFLDDIPAPRQKAFDLVTIIHTLEHVQDPLKLLVEIREKWIAENGLLVIEVPQPFQNQVAYCLPHVVLFNKRTLTMMLRAAGFEPIDWFNSKDGWGRMFRHIYAMPNQHLLVAAVPTEPRDTIKPPPIWERIKRYKNVDNLPVGGYGIQEEEDDDVQRTDHSE